MNGMQEEKVEEGKAPAFPEQPKVDSEKAGSPPAPLAPLVEQDEPEKNTR